MNNIIEFSIPHKGTQPVGQLYLGVILAISLFISFFFGNILFFLIVLIISIFIFLEKEEDIADENGNIKSGFYEKNFLYGKKEYKYEDLKYFTFYDKEFEEGEILLRLSFRSRQKADLFIRIPDEMHKQKIYDIIRKPVTENKEILLSFTEQIVLRFF